MFYFLSSLVLCFLVTFLVRRFAIRFAIVDLPQKPRKIHTQPIPLLGGVGIYLSFVLILGLAILRGDLLDGVITSGKITGIIVGGFFICLVGFLDDKYDISSKSFIGPLLASLFAVIFGVAIIYTTNPFVAGTGPYGRALLYFTPFLGSILSFFWLLGMMYTTKFLDGLDGLVSGIGAIGAFVLYLVSLYWDIPQSGTSVLALILAGACLGFLIHNWNPAHIFLGESGSVFIGFMLGTLAIISGAKIATTLLIMGIPILDVLWVIFRRIFREKKSPFVGDRKHLHFRLLDLGFSQQQVVLFLYFLSIVFGVSSLFLQSRNKIIALLALTFTMIFIAFFVINKNTKNHK